MIPRRLKSFLSIQPAALLAAMALLVPLLTGFALYEYSHSRRDTLSMIRAEGDILLEALQTSGRQSVLAYERLEDDFFSGLLRTASEARDLHGSGIPTARSLSDLLRHHGSDAVFFLSPGGRPLLVAESPGFQGRIPAFSDSAIRPVLSGQADTLVIETGGPDTLFAFIFVALRLASGGAVAAGSNALELNRLRSGLGPGRLMQEMARKSGAAYIVLQDSLGIRMASRGVSELSSIRSDPFLRNVLETGRNAWRRIPGDGGDVFEFAGPFGGPDDLSGLFRVGLDAGVYDRMMASTRTRIFLSSLVLVFIGLAAVSLYAASERMRTLAESYRRFRTNTGRIFENLADAVIVTDRNGRVSAVNRAAETLFDFRSEDIVGKPMHSGSPCSEPLREVLSGKDSVNRTEVECRIRGEKKILSMRAALVSGPSGREKNAAILVATDLTERKRLEDRLRERERFQAMGSLAAGVAHEIRNPINAAGLISQRFLKEFRPVSDEDEYRSLAESMVREIRRVDEIIRRFLEFSRMAPPSFRPSAAEAVIRETVDFFKSAASAREIRLTAPRKDPVVLRMDSDQIKQAILNLLGNALDATPAGGEVTLSGIDGPNAYCFEVADDGPGIPESVRTRIFDLYFTTKSGGTGMGLPIAMHVAAAHGGTLEGLNRPAGGALFRLCIPKENAVHENGDTGHRG
ncbi:MAG: ATP-binding protein [bacterium]|nr:ATP-binding protein [bacterium]